MLEIRRYFAAFQQISAFTEKTRKRDLKMQNLKK